MALGFSQTFGRQSLSSNRLDRLDRLLRGGVLRPPEKHGAAQGRRRMAKWLSATQQPPPKRVAKIRVPFVSALPHGVRQRRRRGLGPCCEGSPPGGGGGELSAPDSWAVAR